MRRAAAQLRIDELFFRVLLGYFYSLYRESVEDFMRPTANGLMTGRLRRNCRHFV